MSWYTRKTWPIEAVLLVSEAMYGPDGIWRRCSENHRSGTAEGGARIRTVLEVYTAVVSVEASQLNTSLEPKETSRQPARPTSYSVGPSR